MLYYGNFKSRNSALLTIFTNRLGDVAIIIRLGIFVGIVRLDRQVGVLRECNFSQLGIILLVLAAFTKRAQVPFSS